MPWIFPLPRFAPALLRCNRLASSHASSPSALPGLAWPCPPQGLHPLCLCPPARPPTFPLQLASLSPRSVELPSEFVSRSPTWRRADAQSRLAGPASKSPLHLGVIALYRSAPSRILDPSSPSLFTPSSRLHQTLALFPHLSSSHPSSPSSAPTHAYTIALLLATTSRRLCVRDSSFCLDNVSPSETSLSAVHHNTHFDRTGRTRAFISPLDIIPPRIKWSCTTPSTLTTAAPLVALLASICPSSAYRPCRNLALLSALSPHDSAYQTSACRLILHSPVNRGKRSRSVLLLWQAPCLPLPLVALP